MSRRSVLIRCAAPRPEDKEELEHWLAGRVRAVAGDGALLYCYAPPPEAASDRSDGAWVVELGAPGEAGASDSVSALLGEMRMLGLDPAVFGRGE